MSTAPDVQPAEATEVEAKHAARWLPDRRVPHFVRAAVVGLIAGLIAVAFRRGLYLAESSRDAMLVRLHAHPAWGWMILPLIGLAAGSVAGLLVQKISPDAAGSGIPAVKGVLIRVRRMHWARILPVKFIGGVVGIGAGLSLGREGPTVQMGAAVGQAVGRLLRTHRRTLPQLISCGAGAGLAAAFNAPLAGFIFVLEELQRELSALTYGGTLVATVSAAAVTAALAGQSPSFHMRGIPHLPLQALPRVVVLGILGGLAGVAFNKGLLITQRGLERVGAKWRWILPGVAGVVVGLVAWWYPDAIGGGHAVAERLLTGKFNIAIAALTTLLVLKFFLTIFSYATGAPGGIFAPMLLMGAVLGALLGQVCAWLVPSWQGETAAFSVLGMAAFFASSVRAPLTGIVLILEMTANQEQLFSLCVTCLVAYLVAERLHDRPVYEALLEYDLLRRGIGEPGPEPTVVVIGIHHGAQVEGKRIRQAGFPEGCLVVEVERAGRELLPYADLELSAGDHIKVLTPGQNPEKALDVVRMCTHA